MAKLNITYNGEDKNLQTDDFDEKQQGIYNEAITAEQELSRYKYLTAIFQDRRDFLIGKLIESVEAPEVEEEVSDTEET